MAEAGDLRPLRSERSKVVSWTPANVLRKVRRPDDTTRLDVSMQIRAPVRHCSRGRERRKQMMDNCDIAPKMITEHVPLPRNRRSDAGPNCWVVSAALVASR